jgi:mannose-1-phosphate guanylyltransferase
MSPPGNRTSGSERLIDGVCFAAGLGERLRPLTAYLPKPALPVLDVPLAAWSLAALAAECERVLVNVGHLHATVVDALRPVADFEVLNEQPEPYGTAGTLWAVRDGLAESFVTMSGDILSGVSLRSLRRAHRRAELEATVAVTKVERGADFSVQNGLVTEFIDRRERASAPGHLFVNVAMIARGPVALVEGPPAGLAERLLRPLVEGGRVSVFETDAYFLDVGNVDRYLQANLDVLEGRAPPPPIALPGRVVEVAGGKAYIGPEAEVDTAALGAGAVVLARSRVESGARVKRSVVWPDEVVPAGTELVNEVWALGRHQMPESRAERS